MARGPSDPARRAESGSSVSDAVDQQKQAAGELAASWVESGMVVGLGTGSTAVHAIRAIGARID